MTRRKWQLFGKVYRVLTTYFLDNPGINNVNLLALLLKSARRSSWRSSSAQQFTKRDFKAFFNSHFSFIKVGWLQAHVSILLAFHKIRIPHEKYCKSATKLSSANLPINIDTDASFQKFWQRFRFCSS